VSLEILKRLANEEQGNFVVISGITPTPLGEGKSTMWLVLEIFNTGCCFLAEPRE
jgi:formyltetrahydrofolate synthetase